MSSDDSQGELDFSSIEDVWVELKAELGHKTVSFSELMNLEVGGILQLGRATGENVDLLAGTERLGSGEILVVDSALALRLADLSDGNPDEKESGPPRRGA